VETVDIQQVNAVIYQRNKILRVANASNGLAFPPYDEISMFLSQHGHHIKTGYFRIDAMPHTVTAHLLQGGKIVVVDATRKSHGLPDGIKKGLTTWCLVFNRAIGYRRIRVAEWETPEMRRVAFSNTHKKTVQAIRRLARILGDCGPVWIGKDAPVMLEIHHNFRLDDKPHEISKALEISRFFKVKHYDPIRFSGNS